MGDYRTALLGMREARECLALLAKLRGLLDERAQVNLSLDPQFQVLVGVPRDSLAPHPELLERVLLALEAAERDSAR